jgi:hypothetical protein
MTADFSLENIEDKTGNNIFLSTGGQKATINPEFCVQCNFPSGMKAKCIF